MTNFFAALLFFSTLSLSCRSQSNPQSPANADTQPATQAPATTQNEDSTYNAIDPEVPDKRPLWVSMERTPCFGTCPWFKAEIFRDGYVIYNGKKFVENEGWFHAYLNHQKMQDLKAAIEELNAENLQDEYTNINLTDLPSTITTIHNNNNIKQIKNGYYNPPEQLVLFEKFIDHLLLDVEWKKLPQPENEQE